MPDSEPSSTNTPPAAGHSDEQDEGYCRQLVQHIPHFDAMRPREAMSAGVRTHVITRIRMRQHFTPIEPEERIGRPATASAKH